MGRQVEEGHSSILECMQIMFEETDIPATEIARRAGLKTTSQLYNFLYYTKATQLIRAEKIAEAMGFTFSLKRM